MEIACCFTGHRPNKLPWGYDEEWPDCIRLKVVLATEIKAMIDRGVTTFYTGMAHGADMWCAEIVQSFQENLPELGIKLIAVIPYEGQANRWSNDYRERYFNILEKADEGVSLQEHYSKGCMQERNRYIVDHASHVIAVYGGKSGGTQYTVEYARRKNREVVVVDPSSMTPITQPPTVKLILLKGKE